MDHFGKILSTLILTFTITACSVGNRVASNGQNVSTSIGNISVVNGEHAGNIDTTNGNIDIGDKATTISAKTTNGNINVGNSSKVDDLATVNGNIEIGNNTIINGNVKVVNGNISINQNVEITGGVFTTSGDISLAENSKVAGDITFEESIWASFSDMTQPTLKIAKSATVVGNIYLYLPVKLELANNFDRTKIIKHYQSKQ